MFEPTKGFRHPLNLLEHSPVNNVTTAHMICSLMILLQLIHRTKTSFNSQEIYLSWNQMLRAAELGVLCQHF